MHEHVICFLLTFLQVTLPLSCLPPLTPFPSSPFFLVPYPFPPSPSPPPPPGAGAVLAVCGVVENSAGGRKKEREGGKKGKQREKGGRGKQKGTGGGGGGGGGGGERMTVDNCHSPCAPLSPCLQSLAHA